MNWLRESWAQAETRAKQATRHSDEVLALVHARLQTGAPDPRDEAWRYFPLRPLLARPRAETLPGQSGPAPSESLFEGALRLVFCDGRYQAEHSTIETSGLVLERTPAIPWFELKQYQERRDAFTALNLCRSEDALTVRVPAHLRIDQPLHVHWMLTSGESHARLQLLVDEGASLDVVEHHHGRNPDASIASSTALGTIRLEAQLGREASLHVLRRLDDQAGCVRLARSEFHLHDLAKLVWTGLERSAGTARHELQINYLGPGANAKLANASVLGERAYSETRLEHRHLIAETQARTLWKILADGRSRGVFNGRIFIAKGADQTDAELRTSSMLLSDSAEVDTKPELEIYADEVKAAHGATVGQLDANALFYLRSRGLGLPATRDLLLRAFVLEIGSNLTHDELRAVLARDFADLFPESVDPHS